MPDAGCKTLLNQRSHSVSSHYRRQTDRRAGSGVQVPMQLTHALARNKQRYGGRRSYPSMLRGWSLESATASAISTDARLAAVLIAANILLCNRRTPWPKTNIKQRSAETVGPVHAPGGPPALADIAAEFSVRQMMTRMQKELIERNLGANQILLHRKQHGLTGMCK